MRSLKKFLTIFLAIICLISSVTVGVSAKTYSSGYSMICSNTKGYRDYNNTRMIGQTYVEKYVTVSKNKVLQVKPYTTTNNGNKIKNYVRFTVWVYDINTGKRVVNKVCSNNGYITWKNTTGKTAHLSVQVRPYIDKSAWKKYSYADINAYISSSQYKFKCNDNY